MQERKEWMASQVLSADSHVLEPPDLWTTRMQRKFRDRAPHLIHEYNGQTGDFLACEGLRPFNPTSLGNAGIPPEEHEQFSRGGYAICRPGSWDPVERLKDMDFDSIGAEIFYCGYGMSLFSHPDDEFHPPSVPCASGGALTAGIFQLPMMLVHLPVLVPAPAQTWPV